MENLKEYLRRNKVLRSAGDDTGYSYVHINRILNNHKLMSRKLKYALDAYLDQIKRESDALYLEAKKELAAAQTLEEQNA